MGMPISASYLLVAIIMVPSLWQLGVEKFASHFFAFYFAVWATITPPVASSALVASRLADGPFWGTGFTAMKMMIVPILLPFAIALHPNLLNFPLVGWDGVLISFSLLLTAAVSAVAIYSWFIVRLNRISWYSSWLAMFSLMAFIFTNIYVFLIVGLVLTAIVVLIQMRLYLANKQTYGTTTS
jgi:TRAP-type uncharacterized transport system fused permease subunit